MSAAPRVLVVGAGLAGLTAALRADDEGNEVTLLTKDALDASASALAQGGIAVTGLGDRTGDADSPAAHAADTLAAGAGLGDPAAVEALTRDAAGAVHALVSLGVDFDRAPDGSWARGLEAAHRHERILHAGGDRTGAHIVAALAAEVRRRDIRVLEGAFLHDLLVDDGAVRGAVLLWNDTVETERADAVVLATGGVSALFAHRTSAYDAGGDGLAAALRVGATARDLEFVQFHPTVLAGPAPFLVSEAVRGEGAVLLDADGRRFLPAVHPAAELAPRDIVARAVAERMALQGGAPVLLDAGPVERRHGPGFLAGRFPTIDRAVRETGRDWAHDPVPVTPAAHYLMGGLATDLHGRTDVPGLYAVGEVACTGVHGANRLASNSLLEAAVFGARAGTQVRRDVEGAGSPRPRPRTPRLVPVGGRAEGGRPLDRDALRTLMWDAVGPVRTEDGLRAAADRLHAWAEQVPAGRDRSGREDENMLLVAQEIVAAARRRTRSVGAHHRADAPDALATMTLMPEAAC